MTDRGASPGPAGMLTRRTALVLAISGAAGFFFGLVVGPTWQDAVEPAQVLAGLVHYPPDNPVFLYSTKTWTPLHQIAALLLRVGLDERTVSLLFSAMLGAMSFMALSLVLLATSDDGVVAATAPGYLAIAGISGMGADDLFAFSAPAVTEIVRTGVGYPVAFFGASYTYGIFGLAACVGCLALLAIREDRAAAVCLGLLPAAHPAIGAWTWLIVAALAAVDARRWRLRLRAVMPWLAGGIAAMLVSLLIHVAVFSPHLTVDPATAQRFHDAIFMYWDEHRHPINWRSDVVAMSYASVLLAGAWTWRMRHRAAPGAAAMLGAATAAFAVGGVMAALIAVRPDLAPDVLRAAMPSRLLNVSVFAGLAMIVGLAIHERASLFCQAVLAALVVILAFARAVDPYVSMRVAAILLALWAVFWGGRASWRGGSSWSGRLSGRPWDPAFARVTSALRTITMLVLIIVPIVAAVSGVVRFRARVAAWFLDRTTDQVLALASTRPGLLVTASNLHFIQLRTRRPVLLDGGALDALAYVPEAAPSIERIATAVYGISLLRPPFDARHSQGFFPPETGRILWRDRTIDEWRHVGAAFGATDVLTPADWALQLPKLGTGAGLTLWSIPAGSAVPE